uniref:Uncharacterized protein n=1 Tax=Glossina brevipalpis TaxID=37001 RepID=A0A1A9WN95_9MUSC
MSQSTDNNLAVKAVQALIDRFNRCLFTKCMRTIPHYQPLHIGGRTSTLQIRNRTHNTQKRRICNTFIHKNIVSILMYLCLYLAYILEQHYPISTPTTQPYSNDAVSSSFTFQYHYNEYAFMGLCAT